MAQAKRGSFATINMILAFLVIGGFMYWLSIASEPTEVAMAEEEPAIPVVSIATFAESPAMYTGTEIELQGVEVVEAIGSHAFFFSLPEGEMASYLARVQPQLVAEGLVVLTGDQGTLVGTVHAMTDSVFDAWTQEGIFVGGFTTQRDEVGGVPSFFEARDIRLDASAPAPPAGQ